MSDDDLESYNRVPMRRVGTLVYRRVEKSGMSRRKQLIIIVACSFTAGFLVTFLVGRFIL